MRNTTLAHAFILGMSLIAASCSKDVPSIEEYLTDNQLTATEHPSGIYYIIETPGTGGSPNLNSTVTAKYKGFYLDGEVFDQTGGNATATFPLQDVIEGWQIAVPLLQRGGKGTFFIPAGLAYGSNPPSGIRKNADLAFEIELVDFN